MKSIENYILEKLKLSKNSVYHDDIRTMDDLYAYIHKMIKDDPFHTKLLNVDIKKLKPGDEFEKNQKNMVETIATRYAILEVIKLSYDKLKPHPEKYDHYNDLFILDRTDHDHNIEHEKENFSKLDFIKIDTINHVERYPEDMSYIIDMKTDFGVNFKIEIHLTSGVCSMYLLDNKFITKKNRTKYDIRKYLEL